MIKVDNLKNLHFTESGSAFVNKQIGNSHYRLACIKRPNLSYRRGSRRNLGEVRKAYARYGKRELFDKIDESSTVYLVTETGPCPCRDTAKPHAFERTYSYRYTNSSSSNSHAIQDLELFEYLGVRLTDIFSKVRNAQICSISRICATKAQCKKTNKNVKLKTRDGVKNGFWLSLASFLDSYSEVQLLVGTFQPQLLQVINQGLDAVGIIEAEKFFKLPKNTLKLTRGGSPIKYPLYFMNLGDIEKCIGSSDSAAIQKRRVDIIKAWKQHKIRDGAVFVVTPRNRLLQALKRFFNRHIPKKYE